MATDRNGLRRIVFAAEVVLATAILAIPLPVPSIVILVLAASIALERRGTGWSAVGLVGENAKRDVLAGMCSGLFVAGTLALALGIETNSEFLLLSGNARALVPALLVTLATSAASEMLFRGYVMARAERAWGEASLVPGLVTGAFLSAIAADPSTIFEATGAFVMASGYGVFYLASGRRLLMPICVHFTVEAAAIVFEFAGIQ